MRDPADRSQAVIELNDKLALQRRAPEAPPATGTCLYCDEPTEPGRRWCDAECRDEWEAQCQRK